MMSFRPFKCLLFTTLLLGLCAIGCGGGGGNLPNSIRTIMKKPIYSGATWALRVVDVKSGAVIYNLNSNDLLLTASTRKLYSVAVTLNQLSADYRLTTPVFQTESVDASENLNGNLVLVAKGDVTMGGRDNGDDTVAVTDSATRSSLALRRSSACTMTSMARSKGAENLSRCMHRFLHSRCFCCAGPRLHRHG
jgi:D-alanyl-D-alanine carboxypeptidase